MRQHWQCRWSSSSSSRHLTSHVSDCNNNAISWIAKCLVRDCKAYLKSCFPASLPNMSTKPLRERLQGCWRLESYTALPTANSAVQRPTYPMTKNVTGLIMYTHNGYVSAQLTIPGQKDFDGKNDEHWAEAGKRFFAYSGPFYVSTEGSEGKEVLRHQFEICILPTRTGEIELRSHRFEEDGQVLVLGGVETVEIKGDMRIPVLRWRRVKDNTNVPAPRPIPEIKLG